MDADKIKSMLNVCDIETEEYTFNAILQIEKKFVLFVFSWNNIAFYFLI